MIIINIFVQASRPTVMNTNVFNTDTMTVLFYMLRKWGKHFSHWEYCFHSKATLLFAKRLSPASRCVSRTRLGIFMIIIMQVASQYITGISIPPSITPHFMMALSSCIPLQIIIQIGRPKSLRHFIWKDICYTSKVLQNLCIQLLLFCKSLSMEDCMCGWNMMKFYAWSPFYWHWLTVVPTKIRYHMPGEVWNKLLLRVGMDK